MWPTDELRETDGLTPQVIPPPPVEEAEVVCPDSPHEKTGCSYFGNCVRDGVVNPDVIVGPD